MITLERIKQVVSMNADLKIEKLTPCINQAYSQYLSKLVGIRLSNDIKLAINGQSYSTDTDKMEVIQSIAEEVIITAAICIFLPQNQLVISNNGNKTLKSDDHQSARLWEVTGMIDSVKETLTDSAFNLIDIIHSDRSGYPLYSSTFERVQNLLIQSPIQFNEFKPAANIDNWFNIQTAIRLMQTEKVTKHLGKQLVTELVAAQNSATLSSEQASLLEFIRPALAMFAYAFAIESNTIALSDQAISKSSSGHFNDRSAASPTLLKNAAAEAYKQGSSLIMSGVEFIRQNLSSFPSYSLPDRTGNSSTSKIISFI